MYLIAQYPLPLGKHMQGILILIYALVLKPIQFSMLQKERMYRPFKGQQLKGHQQKRNNYIFLTVACFIFEGRT